MRKILILLLIVLGSSCHKMPVERSFTGLLTFNIDYDSKIITVNQTVPKTYKFRTIERKIYSSYIDYYFNVSSDKLNNTEHIIFRIYKNGESVVKITNNNQEYFQKCAVINK